MNKYFSIFLFLVYSIFSSAQVITKNLEQFPVFSSCENQYNKELETCFYTQVQGFIYTNFKVPENLTNSNFKGNVIVLFEVDENGKFNVQYVDAVDDELVKESKRVFKQFPQIGPPTFNGKPTYSKYSINRILGPLRFNLISRDWITEIGCLGGVNFKNLKKIKLLKTNGLGFISLIKSLASIISILLLFSLLITSSINNI